MKIHLGRLEGVPPEAKQGMIRAIVWDLDFLRDCVAAGDSRLAGVQSSTIHALAAAVGVGVECVASKPVIPVTCLIRGAVRIISTALSINIGTFQFTIQEAVLGGLFLLGRWEISRGQKQVD